MIYCITILNLPTDKRLHASQNSECKWSQCTVSVVDVVPLFWRLAIILLYPIKSWHLAFHTVSALFKFPFTCILMLCNNCAQLQIPMCTIKRILEFASSVPKLVDHFQSTNIWTFWCFLSFSLFRFDTWPDVNVAILPIATITVLVYLRTSHMVTKTLVN